MYSALALRSSQPGSSAGKTSDSQVGHYVLCVNKLNGRNCCFAINLVEVNIASEPRRKWKSPGNLLGRVRCQSTHPVWLFLRSSVCVDGERAVLLLSGVLSVQREGKCCAWRPHHLGLLEQSCFQLFCSLSPFKPSAFYRNWKINFHTHLWDGNLPQRGPVFSLENISGSHSV